MITKCCFCDYKKIKPLSREMLKLLVNEPMPMEDWILWMDRMMQQYDLDGWTSVKIHMGMKHKDQTYKYIHPIHEFDATEERIINEAKIK